MVAVCAKALTLTTGLVEALRRVNGRVYKAIVPTPATVSTMTITATLNVKHVCRDSVAIALSVVDGDGPLSVNKVARSRLVEDGNGGQRVVVGKPPRKRRTPATFFNQITIHHGTKSVKVFNNGRMHVTGCTSPTQFMEVASAVCEMMTNVAGIDANDGSGKVGVVDFAINMINLNFGVGAVLHLQALQSQCTALGYVASYDSDTYPGLNVKLPVGDRRITALVFKSGKVIITGAKTAEELEQAHVMIIEASCQYDAFLQNKFNVPQEPTYRRFLQANALKAQEETRKLHVCNFAFDTLSVGPKLSPAPYAAANLREY